MNASCFKRQTVWLWFLIVSLSFPRSGIGIDTDRMYAIVGIGNNACDQFVEARRTRRDVAYMDWLGGYLTAVNAVSDNTFNIMGHTEFSSLILWIENYCSKNPLQTFARAVNVLIVDTLFDKRNIKLHK